MKKYRICLFLFVIASVICIITGVFVSRGRGSNKKNEEPSTEMTVETATEEYQASNQKQVENKLVDDNEILQEEYYLVVEDGFLLVFLKDRKTICLYTHIPIMDFPGEEQKKLREGIWFSSMIEVINYLESYTS